MDFYTDRIIIMNNLVNIYNIKKTVDIVHQICVILKEIENEYISKSNLDNTKKNSIYNLYKFELYNIAKTLRKNSKLKIARSNIKVFTYIDTVLEPVFNYVSNTQKILEYIENIFSEFMKGITYFNTNTGISRPIYHRDNSCGSRNQLSDLDCTNFYDNPNEFSRRSLKVKKCYIERLVYDKIFSFKRTRF